MYLEMESEVSDDIRVCLRHDHETRIEALVIGTFSVDYHKGNDSAGRPRLRRNVTFVSRSIALK
jgi:hypothetical protein